MGRTEDQADTLHTYILSTSRLLVPYLWQQSFEEQRMAFRDQRYVIGSGLIHIVGNTFHLTRWY